ncbi:MAG: thioredoxin family protein [Gemmatimonadetes bacterium]|nr:thioredoxin family protein [Gemmatimonadota bacterium]
MTTIKETLMEAPASLEFWWNAGITWDRYLAEEIETHRDLWEGVYRRATTPVWTLEALEDMGREWKLIAIAEDWCGDASNLVPVFARLARDSQWIDLRIVKRDESPELMDMYLTNGSRSIPIVVVMDGDFRPVGPWGPRPADLQKFVIREKGKGDRPALEIYKDTRRWYARDRGRTTLREMLAVMAGAG